MQWADLGPQIVFNAFPNKGTGQFQRTKENSIHLQTRQQGHPKGTAVFL